VFPDGEPLHVSRILLALERAGLVTDHVEGFPTDYLDTTREWARRFEARYDDAVRIAGPERARVWRLYLHAAQVGFESGFEAVYQVRCRRPEPAALAGGELADATRAGQDHRPREHEYEPQR
jgi:cyclopropane-fatty-acyl-phospholipid synthase